MLLYNILYLLVHFFPSFIFQLDIFIYFNKCLYFMFLEKFTALPPILIAFPGI
jgi:hypothetical protein